MQSNSRETKPGVYYIKMGTLSVIFHWCCEDIAVIMHTCHKLAGSSDEKICIHSNCPSDSAKNYLKTNRKACYELSLNLNNCRL